MATRITWSKSEREALYGRMVELFVGGRFTETRTLLRMAQEVLPAERRRKVTDGMVFNYKEMVAKARSEAYTRQRDRKLTEVALQAAPTPAAPAPVELSLGELFEKLVAEVTRRVTAEVRAALAAEQPAASPAPTTPAHGNARERLAIIDAPSERQRKTSALVIGLNGQQVTIAKQQNPDLDLICLTAEEALSRSPIRADYTVLMTKFINHGVQSKYRQVPNLKYCNGGVTDLGAMLRVVKGGL